MKKTLILGCVLLAVAMAVPCLAEILPGSFSLSPYIGGYTYDGEQHLKTRPTYGIRGGYNFTKNWALEGVFGGTLTEQTRDAKADATAYTYRLEGLYHFLPDSRLVPFVAAGIGLTSFDYSADAGQKDRTDGILDYGAGLKYFITDSLALRGDVRHIFDTHASYNNLEYTVGLSFAFGGTKPVAKEVPPPAPAPAPAPAVEPAPAPEPPPAPAAEEPRPGLMKYCIDLNIEFDIDKAAIRPEYHDQLKRVGDFMKKYPTTTAVIEGNTDNVGGYEYNMKLSQRRAESVVNYLVENFGIERSRLSAKGYGYTRPIADNATEEGKQRNRRTSAVIDCVLESPKFIADLPDRLCVSLNIQFDTDQAVIKPEYHNEIAKVGDFMNRFPTTTAVIEGHTDNVGGSKYNMELSQRRAEAVVNYLVDKFGIDRSRLSAKGYGDTRPIGYNTDPAGRAMNRRIDAIIDCAIKKKTE
ncbi:membrane protein [Geotalea uraniireducens]|uniref:Membrane protein n=1 Tax=Geotalea uraniireducens TaxID=351604 RepID=A0ABM8ENH2_9BACT|nr:OmpA family protein [Geotalea uraniireducens]BDV44007.1 membrane protein [Geotalea uraniireducens]